MPNYEYTCPRCAKNVERVVSISERDNQACECGEPLSRTEISSSQVTLADKQWRTGAILGNGQKVPGNFAGRVKNPKGFM